MAAAASAIVSGIETWHRQGLVLTLIVDDHALFSEGLRLLLREAIPDAEVVCCNDGARATDVATGRPFDLVLLDWNLGSHTSGIQVLGSLKAVLPAVRVVIISGDCDAALVRQAIDGGAVGFVPKESSSALLIDALTVTAHGGIYLPRSVLDTSATSKSATPDRPGGVSRGVLTSIREMYPRLTPRHIDVLNLVVRGMSNKLVARHLEISDGTVKQHLNAIFRELDVDNRTEAVYLLARAGVRF